MSEHPRDLVVRSLQMFERPELVDELIHERWLNHEAVAERRHGRDGARSTVDFLRRTFGPIRFDTHHVVADGDLVAAHLTLHGRHVGPIMGLEPTGRPFAVPHVHLFRVEDGQLAEHWAVRDDVGFLQQVGALPVPGGG